MTFPLMTSALVLECVNLSVKMYLLVSVSKSPPPLLLSDIRGNQGYDCYALPKNEITQTRIVEYFLNRFHDVVKNNRNYASPTIDLTLGYPSSTIQKCSYCSNDQLTQPHRVLYIR